MRSVRFVFCLSLSGLAPGLFAAAMSDLPASAPVAAANASASPGTDAATEVDSIGRRVDSATLARLSGGSDLSQSITLNGTVSDNQVDHAISGDNIIGGDALRGAMGLPMVIQNTGNGVLIQNATIINVQLQP